MIDAIVYISNAGHTKRYAEILAEKLGLKVYSFKESKSKLKKKSNIIFLTWIKKGKMIDLKKARNRYNLKAVCAVGMSQPTKSAVSAIQNKNNINALKEKFFYMQGGFDMKLLTGINKVIMTALEKSLSKVSEARALPLEQKEMLRMLQNPVDNVKVNNIKEIYSWYNREMK